MDFTLRVFSIGVSALAFRTLYFALGELVRGHVYEHRPGGPAASPPFVSRYVSSVHAALLVVLGVARLVPGTASLFPGLAAAGDAQDAWADAALVVPLGYLLHDALLLLSEPSLSDMEMLAHHGAFAAAVVAAHRAYPQYTALAFVSELTVLGLNAGWMMHNSGAQVCRPKTYAAVVLYTVSTFFVLRVLMFPALAIQAALVGEPAACVALSALSALNWAWFRRLLNIADKRRA